MKSGRELKTNLHMAEFELLVPANNKKTAKQAILAGADAIFIGYSHFGARIQAGNSISDLIEIIDFAHIYRAKVYITLNTILNDYEIIRIEKLINKLYEIKADGIIIQDMGILELNIPDIPLIASTQCNNCSIEKIQFFEKTGFKRVILPRELNIKEIQDIKNQTNIELECFIHGALCMSYSGQCYMSLVNGGRSANRGECAQPCRKKYSLTDADGKYIVKNKHILSLKDLNLSEHLEKLILIGVTSFKIEGRLKNEAYVINTTAFYRQLIDRILKKYNLKRSSEGNSQIDFKPNLYKTFNRGYTNFNFTGKKENIATIDYTSSLGEFAGIVTKVKKNYFSLSKNILNNGDGICFFNENKKLTGTNINKTEDDLIFPAEIKDIKEGTKIYRNYDKNFEQQLKNSDIKRQVQTYINVKETDMAYWFFIKDNEGNCAVYGIKKTYDIAKKPEMAINTLKIQLSKSGNTEFKIEIKNIDIDKKNIPYLKVSEINEIRRILIEKLRKIRYKSYKNEYIKRKTKAHKYIEKEVDYKANIYNNKAALFYQKRGVKIKEFALESQTDFCNREIMISKYCLKNQFGLCPKQNTYTKSNQPSLNFSAQYKEPFILKDEFNKKYLVEFDCSMCIMKVKTY